jgi:hypothetical protein
MNNFFIYKFLKINWCKCIEVFSKKNQENIWRKMFNYLGLAEKVFHQP